MWEVTVLEGEGKNCFLAVILPNVLIIYYCWHFLLKQEVWTEEQTQLYWAAAQLRTCTGNHSWEILKKPSKHLWLEPISLKKKNCSVVLRNVCRQLGALKNVSHPSRCHQHCQESNSSLGYLSISFWWCFGGPLPSSILEQVLCLVISAPKNLSQLQDGLL